GGNGDDTARSIAVDSSGRIIFTGTFGSTAALLPGKPDEQFTSQGQLDGFVSVFDPSLSPQTWTPIAPGPILSGQTPGNDAVSGRITGIAADPNDPQRIFIATAGGGVWGTVDGGANWKPLTDNQQ